MRKIALLFSMLLFFIAAYSQQKVVSGTVKNDKGEPVSFATITEVGTKNATTASEAGTFTLKINNGSKILITATGFSNLTISPKDGQNSILLPSAESNLQEVVVTALGITKSKAKLGYAVSTINNEALNRASPTNPLDALSGKVAGANISKTGGPGSSSKVILRGFGVISGGTNQPLYVIDGVPLTDARFGESNNYDFGQTISDLNPNDIENISILRGTSAASLYGSQARNGAIMITTRKGKAGKLKIDLSSGVNFSSVGKLPNLQEQFGQGWGGVFILSENGSWGPKLDSKDRLWGSVVDNSQLIKPFSFIKDNLRDFYETGVELNNSIALSGGNETSNFYLSYNNVNSDGVVPTSTDNFLRNIVSLRTSSKFHNFNINTSFNFAQRVKRTPFTGQSSNDGGSLFEEILQIPVDVPISDLQAYKHKFFNVDNYFTPFAENPYYPLYENKSKQKSNRFFGNVDLGYKFSQELSAQLRVGTDFSNASTFAYKAVNNPKPGSWNGLNPTNPEASTRAADVGSVSEISNYFSVLNGDVLIKHNKAIGRNFALESIAGYNFFMSEQKEVSASITDLLVPGFYNLSNSTVPPKAEDDVIKKISMGVYAQTTIGFKEYLFLTLNARNDWVSTLPLAKNSVFYPGANLSWIASQTFDFDKTNISLLKFRLAYGKTGTDPQPYLTHSILTIGSVNLPFGELSLPFNGVSGFGVSDIIANPNLKPIVTKEAEFGIEAKFLENRIGIDLALYDKRSSGQVFTVPISPGTGYQGLIKNLGEVSNKGIELATDFRIIEFGRFKWKVGYTYTKNWNKVEELDGGPEFLQINSTYDAEMRAYPGKNIFGIYAPVPAYTEGGNIIVNAQTGVPLVADEKAFFGNADFSYMMGLSNVLSYDNLQLNISLDYRKGGIMFTGTGDLLQFTGNAYVTTYNDRRPFIIPNSVVENGSDANGKPIYEENTKPIDEAHYDQYWYHTTNKALSYQKRFFDRSFLKLRDITLSYKLPNEFASKIKSNGITLSLYANNILLWTPKSNVYIDPEATNLGNDLASQFGEFRTGPTAVQYGLSLKANF